MSVRHLVVVDCETSGLGPRHIPVEVAWRDADTGDHSTFVPAHNVDWVLRAGDPVALEINGYRRRLADAAQDDGTEIHRLWRALAGNCLAGSNPGFDWYDHLRGLFTRHGLAQPHHHRMSDISNYAAGVLGIDPRELPGLAAVCGRLGVDPPDHTAGGDVRATVECFAALAGVVAGRRTIAITGGGGR